MEIVGQAVPALGLFVWSLALTAASLWTAARLAPWFLQEQIEPPSLRSFFFQFEADADMNRVRVTVILLAMTVLLACLLAIALLARAMGWQPELAFG